MLRRSRLWSALCRSTLPSWTKRSGRAPVLRAMGLVGSAGALASFVVRPQLAAMFDGLDRGRYRVRAIHRH